MQCFPFEEVRYEGIHPEETKQVGLYTSSNEHVHHKKSKFKLEFNMCYTLKMKKRRAMA